MTLEAAHKTLKSYFGYDTFRPLQGEIIETIFAKKDCVVIMPTGGGKSVCYQVPALAMPGMCVVISPLIALMKDQVEGLKANGAAAAFINSSQSVKEQQEIFDAALSGTVDLLYVSPEKVLSPDFLNLMRSVKLSLVAVDEAHCISQWGHDFRKEYTQLSILKDQFSDVPLVALTATADRLTREDIARHLKLKEPEQFIASFDRPNLSLSVLPGRNRIRIIQDFIKQRRADSGIIYCLSRKNTENVATRLKAAGIDAVHYHAGLSAKERSEAQEKFIKDEAKIIVATIAFGMGIDKSNVRWIIHYNLPKNIEGYYQEIGRAGRDGLPSDTMLFYSYADVALLQKFADESGQPEVQGAKLERMMQYADAQICRRKILLNYFGEHLAEDCGNCDVCKNPPKRFDGTVLAQKALSAIARLAQRKEMVGMNLLVDILRGSNRKDILERGFDQIKTYGAGSDMSVGDWFQAILQFLHLGLVEIAYDKGSALRLTEASWPVLKGEQNVEMVQFQSYADRQKKREVKIKAKTKQELFQEALFEHLRAFRLQVASQQGLAPYLVFSDASLEDMATKYPAKEDDMRQVSGMSEAKYKQYGESFIQEILSFIYAESKKVDGVKPKGQVYLLTYYQYLQNFSVAEMAKNREIKENTIYGHFAQLLKDGYSINVTKYLSQDEWSKIGEAVDAYGHLDEMRPYYEYLKGKVDYGKIRMAVAAFEGRK